MGRHLFDSESFIPDTLYAKRRVVSQWRSPAAAMSYSYLLIKSLIRKPAPQVSSQPSIKFFVVRTEGSFIIHSVMLSAFRLMAWQPHPAQSLNCSWLRTPTPISFPWQPLSFTYAVISFKVFFVCKFKGKKNGRAEL